MKIRVTIDKARLAAKINAGKQAAYPVLAEQILQDCNQYAVPDDGEHILKSSGRTEANGDKYSVTWNAVYAAYQYYGCWPDGSHVVKNHTRGYTQSPSTQWLETTKARYGDDWAIVAQREFERGMR